jgi:hypothetical protein
MAARAPWKRALEAALAPQAGASLVQVTTPAPFAPDPLGRVREVEPVFRSWQAHLPVERLKRDGHSYRGLRTIALEFGRQDEIANVRLGTRAFARELERAGIPHTLDEYTGGHTNRTRKRFEEAVLPFFARVFALERDGT